MLEKSIEESSKEGYYDVYYTDTGKKLIVLTDLNSSSYYEPPLMQQKIHTHYDAISMFYWLLFLSAIIYLVYSHVMDPLLSALQIKK